MSLIFVQFFNQFKNVITQIPQVQQIIPLNTEDGDQNKSEDSYEFEPDEDEILSNLLPKIFQHKYLRQC